MNQPKNSLRVGIIGAGSMGRNHVRVAITNPLVECKGLFDPNEKLGVSVANEFGCNYFHDFTVFLDAVDAVVIASPTTTHFEIAKQALLAGKHCLIEKPITVEIAEALELKNIAQERGLTVSVGHVERYNPVFPELQKILENKEILGVKVNRLSYNTNRANDVDVVLDLMIHDIDNVNKLISEKLDVIGAVGGNFHSTNTDYVTAIIKTQSGIVCDITASKASQTKQRTIQISCADCFVIVDFLRKEIEVNRHAQGSYISDNIDVKYRQEYLVERVFVPNVEPLMAEHTDFADAILNEQLPKVTIEDGIDALRLAIEVQDKCKIA
jgi:predicted dehydrogenase